ncbi:hypothetical protein HDU97_000312 [Phlyctochytrium planicorne]|nr:hypothetical protein HDU97_000312 [Phlyctochytrium planicorne]
MGGIDDGRTVAGGFVMRVGVRGSEDRRWGWVKTLCRDGYDLSKAGDSKKGGYVHASADRSDLETSASESEATHPTRVPRVHSSHVPNSVLHNRHQNHQGETQTNGYESNGGNSSGGSTASTSKRRGPRRGQFKPRSSPLDYEALQREQSPIRGFLVLFWMAMAWYMVTTFYHNMRLEGQPVRLRFLYYISHDGVVLALSDLVLVLSCFLVVPLQWMVQGGFFCLHGISMLMKTHSYTASNLELHYKRSILKKQNDELGQLKRLRDDPETDGKANEEKIRFLLEEMDVIKAELNKKTVQFPNNLTVVNFVDYMLVPTLVYELEYPRTSKFRPMYFFEKAVATMGTFFLLYITVEHYIIPTLAISNQIDFITSLMNLIIPFMVCYLLIFFIIFECICNAFAELTCFADREFYEDWWNSCTFDEYARKWNKPVHEFLLRHVYGDTISNLKLSKTNATFLTFFLSSCFHELVFVVTAKRIRMYMFMLQMLQIPLIWVARIPAVNRQKTLGNMLFWFGMFLGPPLLGVAYCREIYLE